MLRRLVFHYKRIRKQFGGRVLRPLVITSVTVTVLAAIAVTLVERDVEFAEFGKSLYWAVMTILDAGDISYVTTPWGWVIHWILALFGVAILAAVTGAVVGFVIDFLVKEGQGMGAAGYENHIVICGWNATARAFQGGRAAGHIASRLTVAGPHGDVPGARIPGDGHSLRRYGVGALPGGPPRWVCRPEHRRPVGALAPRPSRHLDRGGSRDQDFQQSRDGVPSRVRRRGRGGGRVAGNPGGPWGRAGLSPPRRPGAACGRVGATRAPGSDIV